MTKRLTIKVIDDILTDNEEEYWKEDLGSWTRQKDGEEAPAHLRQAKEYVAANEGEEYTWPSFDDVHDASLAAVENHQGYRDPGLIEGAIGNTQMQQMYGQHEDIFDTAANLIAKLQRQQAIIEGNKRTATAVGLGFLENNGYDTSDISRNEETQDRFIWLVYNISDAVNAGGDQVIQELAQFLREHCSPYRQANFLPNDGAGKAFWYDGEYLHWGATHYMIFHNLYKNNTNMDEETNRENGIFGWIFPAQGVYDEKDYNNEQTPYGIEFGTDFGFGANKKNRYLEQEAAQEIEYYMGYPAEQIYFQHMAGHTYESDDLDNERADQIALNNQTQCQNCGSQIAGDLCGNCGSDNIQWWTEGIGLTPFKGSFSSWQEDNDFNLIAMLDNPDSILYNTKTSNWEDQFEEPIDDDLENFEQETNHLTEAEKQQNGIEGPFDIDGWTVYTRDCKDIYPNHDAIWIDRSNRIILIGWQGHHQDIFFNSPFLQGVMNSASPYDQTAGHFRTEPSQDEPFPAGWGWHGNEGNKEEKNVLKQVIKKHYNVNKLKDLYQPNENAEENYFVGGDEPDEGYS